MSNFMTATENAVWIPEVIANEAIGALQAYLNLGKTVSKDSDLTPVRFGQTISIPKRGVLTATQKTQGSSSTIQKPTGDEVTVTVDQHWYVKVAEEDFTNAMQIGSTLPGYLQDSVKVLAEKIEGRLTTHFSEFDNIDCGVSDNALEKLVDVYTRLDEAKVPQFEDRFGYIHPRFAARLKKVSAFIDPKLIPNNRALTEGTIGRAEGFDIFSGQLVPTSGSPAWYQNFFYTRNALVLASRPLRQVEPGFGVQMATVSSDAGLSLRVTRYYDPTEMGMVQSLDVLFGSAVNDERLAFVLESQ